MTLSSQPLVYASVPLRLGPIAKVLPLSPTHILPTCPMVVLAKESQLQLALIDLQKGTSVLLASQYIFGSIKDIQICHRQTHGSPGVVTSADPGCKLGPVCPATHPTDVLHPERAFYSTVLVATSDSGQLSFIGIAHLEQSQYRFVPLHHYSIASPNANYMELGHLVCADPFFRSVAVTSVQNSFDVLVFSPQLYQGSSFWNEAQHLKIDEPGVILHASFLSPPSENDRILLVLSLCRSQRFYIVVYEYWQVEPRNTMRRIAEIPHTSTSNESCTPLHLLSLPDIPCGFALITETELVVYRILGGSSKSARVMGVARISIADKLDLNPPIIESNYCVSAAVASFCTTRSQAVVASDGPLEQSIYATISAPISNESHLYHIRCVIKDRVAPLVEFGHRLQVPSVKAISPVLGVAPDGHGHYLMLVGDMRNSSVIYTSPTTTYEVQTVYDWSPITDFGLADLHKEGRDSVFLSSGINSNGAVFAARNGIELITEYSTSMLNGMIDMWNLKSDPRQPKDDVLVVSSISATRVLHLNESELVDISAFLGFELEKRTVLASHTETPGVFVQAHTDGVVVSKSALPGDSWSGTGEAEVWDTASVGGGTIVQAAIFDDLLIVVTRNGQTYHKTLLKIMADSGDGPPSIIDMVHEPLECEPSCLITLPTLSNELRRTYLPANIVIMGTHAPGLELMYLDGYGDYRRLECFHRERLASAALGYETPNSIAFLANGQKAYLLVSNRAGQFYAYPWTLVEGRRVVLQQPVCHKIGHRAITFKTRMRWSHSAPFESEAASCDFVLAATDRVWKIGLSSEGDVYVKLLSCDPVLNVAAFDHDGSHNAYMAIRPDRTALIRIDERGTRIRRVSELDGMARRIMFDSTTGKLIALTTTKSSTNGAIISQISVIDPVTKRVYVKETLDIGEVAYSLARWDVKEGKRYICVGTGSLGSQENSRLGRVIVYSLKAFERGHERREELHFKLRQLGEHRFADRVTAICTFKNSYLLVGAGKALHYLKIEAATRTLVSGASEHLRWPIESISTWKDLICVGGNKEGVSIFVYDATYKRFQHCKSDRYAKWVTDALLLDEQLIVSTDKFGGLSAMIYSKKTIEHVLEPVLSYNVGEVITKLKVGSLVNPQETTSLLGAPELQAWLGFGPGDLGLNWSLDEGIDDPESLAPETHQAAECKGLLGSEAVAALFADKPAPTRTQGSKDKSPVLLSFPLTEPKLLIGCSVTGNIHSFMRVGSRPFGILLLLQDILGTHPSTRPLMGNSHSEFRSRIRGGCKAVIDGELVSLYLELSAREQESVVEEWNHEMVKQGWRLFSDPPVPERVAAALVKYLRHVGGCGFSTQKAE